jgi:hypothetical protein
MRSDPPFRCKSCVCRLKLARLEAAQREFSRLNLAGAQREIERALQVDSTFAAAFPMRALLRLATRDPNGAVEDATRAVALDPGNPGPTSLWPQLTTREASTRGRKRPSPPATAMIRESPIATAATR